MSTPVVAPTTGSEHRINVNGVDIFYKEQGDGPAVILLHGGVMDHHTWGNQIPALAQHLRVIAPDTRGHGRSADADVPFTYELFADDALALLAELGIARSHVVGFSDGGAAALIMAMKRPDVVDKVVLVGTAYNTENYFPGTTDGWTTLTWEEMQAALPPAHLEINEKAVALSSDDATFRAFWRKLVNDLWVREPRITADELATITRPVLVLHGEHEQYIERRAAEEMERFIPNARMRIVPGTHTCAQEHPGPVNAAIISFLAVDGANGTTSIAAQESGISAR